jgi:hypothetical protein
MAQCCCRAGALLGFGGLRPGCLRWGLRYRRPDRGLRPCHKSLRLRPRSGAFATASRPSPRAEASVFFPCTLLVKLINRQFLLLLRTLFSVTHNRVPTMRDRSGKVYLVTTCFTPRPIMAIPFITCNRFAFCADCCHQYVLINLLALGEGSPLIAFNLFSVFFTKCLLC